MIGWANNLSYESLSGDVSGQVTVEFGLLDYLFPSFLGFFILLISLIDENLFLSIAISWCIASSCIPI